MPTVKTDSGVKKFPYTKQGKEAAKKAAKKDVLRKYTGKGGVKVKDVAKEIPGTLKQMAKDLASGNFARGVDPGKLGPTAAKKLKKILKRAAGFPGRAIERSMRNKEEKDKAHEAAGEELKSVPSLEQETTGMYNAYNRTRSRRDQ